jgi:hypothetical protein
MSIRFPTFDARRKDSENAYRSLTASTHAWSWSSTSASGAIDKIWRRLEMINLIGTQRNASDTSVTMTGSM